MRLSEGEVHLWSVPLDSGEPAVGELAADEHERAARLRCPQTRSEFIQTRMALRRVLGHYLEVPPQAIAFSHGAQGKPRLAGEPHALHFNVSHSGQLALIALSPTAVGVDLEWQPAQFDWRELLPLCCHPAERAGFQGLSEAVGRARLLRLWTAKEAYLKGRGLGLSLPLTAICLQARAQGWRPVGEAPGGQGWWLQALRLPAGYLGCLATPFPSPRIRFQSLATLEHQGRVEAPLDRLSCHH